MAEQSINRAQTRCALERSERKQQTHCWHLHHLRAFSTSPRILCLQSGNSFYEASSSRDDDNYSVPHQTVRLLRDLELHCNVHRSPQLVPVPSQMNTTHALNPN